MISIEGWRDIQWRMMSACKTERTSREWNTIVESRSRWEGKREKDIPREATQTNLVPDSSRFLQRETIGKEWTLLRLHHLISVAGNWQQNTRVKPMFLWETRFAKSRKLNDCHGRWSRENMMMMSRLFLFWQFLFLCCKRNFLLSLSALVSRIKASSGVEVLPKSVKHKWESLPWFSSQKRDLCESFLLSLSFFLWSLFLCVARIHLEPSHDDDQDALWILCSPCKCLRLTSFTHTLPLH